MLPATMARSISSGRRAVPRGQHRGVDLGEDAPRVREERLSCREDADAARGPLEERGAHLLLEAPDLAAQRGLRDVEPPRGAADVALLGDGDEIADLGEAHRDTISRPYQNGIGSD